MTSIEVLATIFAVLVLVKLAFIRTNPKAWMNFAQPILRNSVVALSVYLVLAAVVGYFIFSSMTIVQVGAVMLFTSLLMGVGLAPYSQVILKVGQEMLTEGVEKAWLSMLIWTCISLWVLYGVLIQVL
jgi:hypothetical protein